MINGNMRMIYISRAYNPNQVFVYSQVEVDTDKFYIENLSTDVNIVHERYYFDNIEIWMKLFL